jgi:hypothetical protein
MPMTVKEIGLAVATRRALLLLRLNKRVAMTASSLPGWVLYLQALAVPTVAVVGAWIGLQQMQIARTKLQHDLYDRRFKVYEAASRLMKRIGGESDRRQETSKSDIDDYWKEASHAPFLFDDRLVAYLHEILEKAEYHVFFDDRQGNSTPLIKQIELMTMFDHPTSHSQEFRDNVLRQMALRTENKKWFTHQLDELVRRFRPVLQLRKPSLFARVAERLRRKSTIE